MSDASPALRRPRRLRRHISVAVLALALTALLFSLALVLPAHAQAGDTHPGGNIQDPVVLNVDIARPAIVRIFFGATNPSVTVRACAAENSTFSLSGTLGGLGSGTFISSHGDILTASHVVKDEGGELEVAILGYLQDKIIADIQKKCGQTVTDLIGFINSNPQAFSFDLSNQTTRVWLDTAYHGPYTEAKVSSVKSFTSHLLGVKDFITQKGIGDDVAIIHLDGFEDSPSVAMGDSTAVSPTDRLTELGYPGNGDINHIDPTTGLNVDQPTDFLTESINSLYVSAIKTNDEGGQLIEIGGNQEHGDSGGPALNAQGQIVGVVSFGPAYDPVNSPDAFPAGTGFLQASNSAQSLVTAAGIDTTPGAFQTHWRQALTDFASTSSGHWHKAVTDLIGLQQNYPDFKGGDDYLTYAQNQAANESTVAINLGGNASYLGYGLGGLAVLALVILLITVIVGRSRSRRRAVREAVAVVSSANPPYIPPSSYPRSDVPPGGYPPMPPQNYPRSDAYPPNYPPNPSQGYGPGPGNPPSSGYGPGSGGPPQPPTQFSAYNYPAPQGGQYPPTTPRAVCVNGHPMQPNETYCSVCGGARG